MKGLLAVFLLINIAFANAMTADEIIQKHFESTGGLAKWKGVVAIKKEGTFEIGPSMKVPCLNYTSADKLSTYFEFSFQGMKYVQTERDNKGWVYNPLGGKREADPVNPDNMRDDNYNADPKGMLYDYKAKSASVDYLGMDDIEGQDVYKLRLITKEGDMLYYYIDAESFYLLKLTYRIRLATKENTFSNVFSDFRKTDYGVIVPFAIQSVNDKDEENGSPTLYEKITINSKEESSWFEKPGPK